MQMLPIRAASLHRLTHTHTHTPQNKLVLFTFLKLAQLSILRNVLFFFVSLFFSFLLVLKALVVDFWIRILK